jgi:hypothetical protein
MTLVGDVVEHTLVKPSPVGHGTAAVPGTGKHVGLGVAAACSRRWRRLPLSRPSEPPSRKPLLSRKRVLSDSENAGSGDSASPPAASVYTLLAPRNVSYRGPGSTMPFNGLLPHMGHTPTTDSGGNALYPGGTDGIGGGVQKHDLVAVAVADGVDVADDE